SRRARAEYVLNLQEPLPRPSSNHKRNITRAQKAGVQVRRTRDRAALADHVNLMSAAMERREQRGEAVPTVHPSPFDSALLTCGAAELFQTHDGSSLLSSILVLRAPRGAYYQSAGTSPEGMEIGASQFLISSVASLLQEEGMHLFNLGGAGDESPGLQRFKAGFGAHPVLLEAASFVFGSRGERAARSLVAKALGAASLPFRKTRSASQA
ncbi:MAG: GNAT family N-acetyltransferase, partial [Gemmatimonadaceae bacterium]